MDLLSPGDEAALRRQRAKIAEFEFLAAAYARRPLHALAAYCRAAPLWSPRRAAKEAARWLSILCLGPQRFLRLLSR